MNLKHFILISALLLFAYSCNQQSNSSRSENNSASEEFTNENVSAIDLHDKLMSHFSDDWIERESDSEIYPEFYGGSFVDHNGIFVVAVTGNQEKNKQLLIEILETEEFKTEIVKYSFKDMMLVMDEIDNFLLDVTIPEDHPVLIRFAGAYPDVMDNRVKVILTEIDDNTITTFRKEISNSPLIIFEQGEIPDLY